MINVFESTSYKTYLNLMLEVRGRGGRTHLAEAIGCHNGYVSQVLNGDANFSLEQGDLINRFLGHTTEQSHFFLLLLQKERAGTKSLRDYFQDQLKSLVEKQFELKDRLQFKRSLTREDQATFYSSWHYGAVHVLVSVPGCHTATGICSYLGLPLEKVLQVLQFLISVGLVTQEGDRFAVGTSHIHLERESPMIAQHHTNWRMQSIQSLDRRREEDLHYSSVITASREDSVKVREILVKAIENVRAVVRESKDEEGYSYAVDFFSLRR